MNDQRIPTGTTRFFILLLSGFVLAQILSTIHLFFSNAVLYDRLFAVHNAGYLAVPNIQTIKHLKDWTPAFNGGLFFSLTSGIGLGIVSICMAWAWQCLFTKKKSVLIVLGLIWAASLIMVNHNGFSSLITTYLIFIPCFIFLLFGKLFPLNDRTSAPTYLFFHMALFILFSIGCASQMKAEKFLDIRDFLFLGNPTGMKINAFYYDNSLYSANYFKSFSQKLIKTCDLESIPNEPLKKKLGLLLSRFDYLAIKSPAPIDLIITATNATIHLSHKEKIILSIPVQEFFHSPQQTLRLFESKIDQHAIFRTITMVALLFVGALLLYSTTFLLPFSLYRKLMRPIWAAMTAALTCSLILFIVFLKPGNHTETSNPEDISNSLRSNNAITRIKTLRHIVDQKMDISVYPESETIALHGTIPERYWLAKALALSRKPNSRNTLLRLLEDNHFNVVCMALYSMGKQGRTADIPIILRKIKTSDNWYVQWYAYKALRNLGWYQKIIN